MVFGANIPYKMRYEAPKNQNDTIVVVESEVLATGQISGKDDVLKRILDRAEQYGASFHELSVVASCESSFNVNAHNPNDPDSGSYGLFQFQRNTFKLFSEELGKEMDIHNPEDQIELAAYAFSKGYQSHWTCWRIHFGA